MKASSKEVCNPVPILRVTRLDAGQDDQYFDNESDFLKDVHEPAFDEIPGESPISFKIRFVFASNGYTIKQVEEVSTHPVLIIRAVRTTAERIGDDRLLFRDVQGLLRQAGFEVGRNELTIGRTGDRIMVAFDQKDSLVDYADGLRRAEEEAQEFADMPP